MKKTPKKKPPVKGGSSKRQKAKPSKNEKAKDSRRSKVLEKPLSAPRTKTKGSEKSGDKRDVNRSIRKAAKGQTKGASKVITATPIKYNQDAINKLRKTLRKSDGTFFSKDYYQSLVKKQKGKSQNEVDELMIKLRNKNPNLRYFVESKSDTLHFQTGSFVDRLSGKIETVKVQRGKRKGKAVKTGDLKKGTKITITDFFGDEITHTNVASANEAIKEQNNIINNIISRLQKDTKLPKGKKLGVYVTVPEKVTSNSEGEIVNISYDYSDITIQGMESDKFNLYLEDELDALRGYESQLKQSIKPKKSK